MSEWWYSIDGDTTGPVSPADLKRLATAGLLARDTLVRTGNDKKWHAAEKVRGLFDVADKSEPPGEELVSPPGDLVPSHNAGPGQVAAPPVQCFAGEAVTLNEHTGRRLRWSRIAAAALFLILAFVGAYYGIRSGDDSAVSLDDNLNEESAREKPAPASPSPGLADQVASLTEEIGRLKKQAADGSQAGSADDRIDQLTKEIDRLNEQQANVPAPGVSPPAKLSDARPVALQRTEIVK